VDYNGETYVIGVLVKGTELPSESYACGVKGRYGVYTAVAKYHDFIKTQLAGGEYHCADCFTGSVRTSCTSNPEPLFIPVSESSYGGITSLSTDLVFSALKPHNWWGDLKQVYETAFALSLNLFDQTTKKLHPHCAVGSTLAARRSLAVRFVANVSDVNALALARKQAEGLSKHMLAANIVKANTILGTSVFAVTEDQISYTGFATSADDDHTALIVASVLAAVVVVIICVGAAFYKLMTGKQIPDKQRAVGAVSAHVPQGEIDSFDSEMQALSDKPAYQHDGESIL